MKKNVINVPKLKIDAINSRLPSVAIMINAIAAPLTNTEWVGIPFFEILANTPGITRCLAIEKIALDPPRIDAMVADVVANSAEMDTNFNSTMLLVATPRTTSRGASEVPIIFQSTSPTSTTATPIYSTVQIKNANINDLGTFF